MKNDKDYIYRLLNNSACTSEDLISEPVSENEAEMIMQKISGICSVKKKKRTAKYKMISAAAAAVLVTVVLPASVYAYSRINAGISKTAPYRNTINIDSISDTGRKEQYMMYEFGYMPEGFEPDEGGRIYHNDETNGEISVSFFHIPADQDKFSVDLKYSEHCENYETEGKTAMINYRLRNDAVKKNMYTRDIWVFFNDTGYLLEMLITEDISHEEMVKIIEGISLFPTDEQRGGEYFPWLDNDETLEGVSLKKYAVSLSELNLYKTGDSVTYPDKCCGWTVTVNSAEIFADTAGKNISQTVCEFISKGGMLKENIRTWIKHGDGINTMDEVLFKESVPYYVVRINASFINNKDTQNEIVVYPGFVSLDSNDYVLDYELCPDAPEGYPYNGVSFNDSIGISHNDNLLAVAADNNNAVSDISSNVLILKAGETVNTEIYMAVSENRIGNSYLYFHSPEVNVSRAVKNGMPLYDLTEIKPE